MLALKLNGQKEVEIIEILQEISREETKCTYREKKPNIFTDRNTF